MSALRATCRRRMPRRDSRNAAPALHRLRAIQARLATAVAGRNATARSSAVRSLQRVARFCTGQVSDAQTLGLGPLPLRSGFIRIVAPRVNEDSRIGRSILRAPSVVLYQRSGEGTLGLQPRAPQLPRGVCSGVPPAARSRLECKSCKSIAALDEERCHPRRRTEGHLARRSQGEVGVAAETSPRCPQSRCSRRRPATPRLQCGAETLSASHQTGCGPGVLGSSRPRGDAAAVVT